MAASRTAKKTESTAWTASGRLSFAKIREPLEVPDLLALQTESFDWLLGNERWQARVAAAKAENREDVPDRSGLEEIFEDNIAVLKFGGGCQGCGMVDVTLKEGVEEGGEVAAERLSGGRVALGLGAGSFWDAIAGMGGPRRTPGESVQALQEAIRVIRDIWDTTASGSVTVHGAHYTVEGAARGPAPTAPIPVWVGAYKPRMLRLVGRHADGWLPSLGYLRPGDLGRHNATIDAAATAAGRDPAHVERLLNVGPDQSVQDLVELALSEGISTFILMADDPRVLRRFGQETAPAVRDGVNAARGGRAGRRTTATALARRREGIDYDNVPAALTDSAIEPGDASYARVKSTYLRGGSPGIVFQVRNTDEVVAALAYLGTERRAV